MEVERFVLFHRSTVKHCYVIRRRYHIPKPQLAVLLPLPIVSTRFFSAHTASHRQSPPHAR